MIIRRLLAGSLVCSLLCALPLGARAQNVDQPAGASLSDGGTFGQLMGLGIASGDKKLAALMIQGPDPSKEEYKPRSAFFADKSEWNQFVKLWNQARITPAPKRTNINGDSTSIGQYWDDADKVLVTVAVKDDATIEFIVIGPDKWPMMFRLRPKDFDEFGRNVALVSAYFEK